MTTRANETTEEITAGNRPLPATNGEWNQQTIFDARNVLQTQQSNENSQQTHEQRSGKSKILFYLTYKLILLLLSSCQTTYISKSCPPSGGHTIIK